MDWNARYLNGDTPWDKGQATPVLAEIASRHPDLFLGKTIIVPGCGTGHDVRWLATQGARATGVDIAPLAIAKAQALDPGEMGSYILANALDPAVEFAESFDMLWEHTCFCALDPGMRPAYISAAARLVPPGGTLAGVFFINPEMDEGEQGPPFGIDAAELEALWNDAGFTMEDTWIPASGFSGREGRERVMILRKNG